MPTTLNAGVGILDLTVEGGGDQNPQDNAQLVTDTALQFVTDTGVLIISNGEQ